VVWMWDGWVDACGMLRYLLCYYAGAATTIDPLASAQRCSI